MSLILVIIIAISLSMDAFSLALAYGTLNFEKKEITLLSTIVGLFHFIMPIIGMCVGNVIINLLPIKPDTVVFMVLFLIGVQMIIESFKDTRKINKLTIIEMFLFAFAVSIDSFTLGLGLKVIYKYPIISALIFSITSFIFTYIGLNIGKKINSIISNYSTILGGIILIIVSILYLI